MVAGGMSRRADTPVEMEPRRDDLDRFYWLLDVLEEQVGGRRRLGEATGRMTWPRAGVYFVFEPGELREDRQTHRVARVGTHGLQRGSRSTMWGRLRQHRGTSPGNRPGGNHRGSIFRLHVGQALANRGDVKAVDTWANGSSAPRPVRDAEAATEAAVSQVIADMTVLWVDIDDPPGPASMRGRIEANAIALLSNSAKPPIDPASTGWLGHHARAAEIRASGLWNVRHVDETYDPRFLNDFERLVYTGRADIAAEERGP